MWGAKSTLSTYSYTLAERAGKDKPTCTTDKERIEWIKKTVKEVTGKPLPQWVEDFDPDAKPTAPAAMPGMLPIPGTPGAQTIVNDEPKAPQEPIKWTIKKIVKVNS